MFDNVCKFIAEKFSSDLALWLIKEPINLTVLEATELQVEPIRADSVIFLQSANKILHVEFQTLPDASIPFRMLDYWVRLHRRYPNKEVYQVVIYLRKTSSSLVNQTTFALNETQHQFNAIRIWEVPSEQLLESPGLLPFAVLSQTDNPENILRQVRNKIDSIEDRTQKSNLTATSAILAGLVLDKIFINRVLNEEIMKESVIYQEIQAEAEARGKQSGLAEGQQLGEANLVLKQLNKRLDTISPDLTAQIRNLSVEELENLGEALLDFQSLSELESWLSNQK